MSFEITCRIKPYIQPFERELAMRELEALAGSSPKPLPNLLAEPECFQVSSRLSAPALARELAFWEVIWGRRSWTTRQSLREATTNVVRNGIGLKELASRLPFGKTVPLPNRRCLRYGSHGLHEYKGKFFPQLVRTLINIAEVSRGGIVGDPFSGSGTTAVETILAERNAVCLDMNPLSVFMAKTKCGILSVKVRNLEASYVEVRDELLSGRPKPRSKQSDMFSTDAEYLALWFHKQILNDLEEIRHCINAHTTGTIRNFMLLALSNILREVSWQKEDDLRVRKEMKAVDEIDPVREFLEELGRSVRLVIAFLRQEGVSRLGSAEIREGDSLKLAECWHNWLGKMDVIITSPPYATALPYLDTDRLSLSFLGLLPRSQHRDRDRSMIGNREITDKTRKNYWHEFSSTGHELPDSVTTLISKIHRLNQKAPVGFRRRNLPSLLYKYFIDMRSVFAGMRTALKPRASAFVVVGNNHTFAGGKRVDILTAELLSDLSKDVGFEEAARIPMEMLVSREIFKKNAIESEYILHLVNPS